MYRMVGLLLFVHLAVVHATRVQLSKIECACGVTRFCDGMKLVYRWNDAVMYLLQDKESFKDDMEGVSTAKEEILEILSEKNKTVVRVRLLNLLTLETSALVYLGSSCNGTTSEKHECEKGLEYLVDAICDLIAAVQELAEASQLEAVKKVGTCPKASEDKNPDQAYGLGMAALNALENIETKLE